VNGSVQVREASNIQSAAAGGRIALNQYTMPVRVFLVGGYRFFNLDESLTVITSSSPGTGMFSAGRLAIFDGFSTKNFFNGGEVGIGAVARRNQWSLAAETRLAMGNMQQTVTIDGRTEAISGGFIAMYPGGLLAQPSNMGTFTRNRFALIPQVDVKLGYQLLPALRLTVGYNFTYVTQLLRPGEQVDTTVNTTQIAASALAGPARPQVLFSESGIWLQGVTAGLQLAF
jgi:predicted porin